MLIPTTPCIEGYRITRYGPLVTAEVVMGTNLFKDYFAKISDVVGGRSGSFQKSLSDAREFVLGEVEKQALAADCNAIIAVDIE